MRILLLHDSLLPSPPMRATAFLTQVVRHAVDAGHVLRELVPNNTNVGKGADQHRVVMRGRLDKEITEFDPQVIHAHGLGVLGHLALESGAPYVVSVFADELLVVQSDSSWRRHAQEAIENAGCVIVDADETRRGIEAIFGEVQAVAVLAELASSAAMPASFGWLWETYREVLARRHGA